MYPDHLAQNLTTELYIADSSRIYLQNKGRRAGFTFCCVSHTDTESDVQSFRSIRRHLSKQHGLLWVSGNISGNCEVIETIHLQFIKIYDALSAKQFSSLKWVLTPYSIFCSFKYEHLPFHEQVNSSLIFFFYDFKFSVLRYFCNTKENTQSCGLLNSIKLVCQSPLILKSMICESS